MTSMIYGAYGRPVALDLDDTVSYLLPEDLTTRDLSTYRNTPPVRRPAADPGRFERRRSFSYLGSHGEPLIGIDPASTAALPLAVQAVIDRERRASDRRRMAPGRHRAANQPSLLARLFGRGRRDGV
jgi:hypothetical protein